MRQPIRLWHDRKKSEEKKNGKTDQTGGNSAVDDRDFGNDSLRAGGDCVREDLHQEKTKKNRTEIRERKTGAELQEEKR